MTSQTERAKAKLDTLSSSFDDLEAMLEPLFSQTLPESIVALETIQQAKLQTVLPYLVYDLVFIYLKSRGIDPKTHPVVPELDRIKEYFNKISNAENPPTKRTEIDKGAAQRFIKHAITQATYRKTPVDETPEPSSSARVQAKITSKMLERQLYEKRLKEQDAQESEEDELEVFDGAEDESMDVDTAVSKPKKTKGKAKEVPSTGNEPISYGTSKRRRPAIDPFAGYGDEHPSNPANAPPSQTSTPDPLARHSKKRALDDVATDSTTGTPGPGTGISSNTDAKQFSTLGSEEAKKPKKAKKKSRKSVTS